MYTEKKEARPLFMIFIAFQVIFTFGHVPQMISEKNDASTA